METVKNITVIPARRCVGNTAKESEIPKLRVAAYCRVSTDSDEQATSYEAQVEHYTDYIRKNPEWELAGIFADDGISGTNTKKREEFNRMIDEAMAGKIDMIVTKSISRFARNTLDCLKYIRQLFFLKHFSLKKRQNSLFLARNFPYFRQDVLCILTHEGMLHPVAFSLKD